MRVLVCGGRDFDDADLVFQTLTLFDVSNRISLLIHGDARGADSLAKVWATKNKIPERGFPADWNNVNRPFATIKHDRQGRPYDTAAGFIRNQRMIDEGKPEICIAFPGGRGTADMVRRARKANIRVIEVTV